MTTFYLLEASQLYKQKTVDVWPKKDNTKYFEKKKTKKMKEMKSIVRM